MSIIQIKNINYISNNINILKNISFDIYQESILSIIGSNGSGKTTLIKILLGILKIRNGQISMNNGLSLAYVPQKMKLSNFIFIKVIDFIKLPLVHKLSIEKINEFIKIDNLLNKNVRTLSGGEMIKVLFARALISNPDVMFLDEPTGYLDYESEKSFYNSLVNIKNQLKCSIVIVSHDLYLVNKFSDYVLCLENGEIGCHGSIEFIKIVIIIFLSTGININFSIYKELYLF